MSEHEILLQIASDVGEIKGTVSGLKVSHAENKSRLDSLDMTIKGNGKRGLLTKIALIEYALLGLAIATATGNPKMSTWISHFLGVR